MLILLSGKNNKAIPQTIATPSSPPLQLTSQSTKQTTPSSQDANIVSEPSTAPPSYYPATIAPEHGSAVLPSSTKWLNNNGASKEPVRLLRSTDECHKVFLAGLRLVLRKSYSPLCELNKELIRKYDYSQLRELERLANGEDHWKSIHKLNVMFTDETLENGSAQAHDIPEVIGIFKKLNTITSNVPQVMLAAAETQKTRATESFQSVTSHIPTHTFQTTSQLGIQEEARTDILTLPISYSYSFPNYNGPTYGVTDTMVEWKTLLPLRDFGVMSIAITINDGWSAESPNDPIAEESRMSGQYFLIQKKMSDGSVINSFRKSEARGDEEQISRCGEVQRDDRVERFATANESTFSEIRCSIW